MAFDAPRPDIFEWYPAYQSCQRYFLNHAQHDYAVQALTALINIRLPYQCLTAPVSNWMVPLNSSAGPMNDNKPFQRHASWENFRSQSTPPWVSLIPYIQRLIITGMDKEAIMHGFFGDDWKKGVGPIHEQERCNYMFAAKSVGWAHVRHIYDISSYEPVPFMNPLQDVHIDEIKSAERSWSRWLAMEDWMIGPRAPFREDQAAKPRRQAFQVGSTIYYTGAQL